MTRAHFAKPRAVVGVIRADQTQFNPQTTMKHTKRLLALTLVAALAVPAVTFAAKGDRKEKGGNAFSKIDTDSNGSISESEFVAANSKRGTAEAAKTKFASLDKNHDGKLDKTELAGAKNDGEKKGRKKKNQE